MKKEIKIKDVIKEMLHQNFKGTKYSRFNEYHLNKEIKSEEYIIYTYEISNYCYIRVHHNLELKEIDFRLWDKFKKISQHNIQYI